MVWCWGPGIEYSTSTFYALDPMVLSSRGGRHGNRLLQMLWNHGFWVVCKYRLNNRLSGVTQLQLILSWCQVNDLELFLAVPVSFPVLQFLSQRTTVFLCSLACRMSAASRIMLLQWDTSWIPISMVADSSFECSSVCKSLTLDSQNTQPDCWCP